MKTEALIAMALLLGCHATAFGQSVVRSELFTAIRAGQLARVNELIANDPRVLQTTAADGATPLMFAAYAEKWDIVQAIQQRTVRPTFHEACILGQTAEVKSYLATGSNVDQRSPDGYSPLALAVFFRRPDVARLLIDAGADVNAKSTNSAQVAPIHAAVARSDLVSLQMLLLKGAQTNLTQQRLMRPIHEAAAAGNLPAVAMLLMFGADPAALNEDGKNAEDFARQAGHVELAAVLGRVAGQRAER